MSDHYDDLETRDPQAREQALFEALPAQIHLAKQKAPAYASLLADVSADGIN
jgi:phenylacetate-CoA ligase